MVKLSGSVGLAECYVGCWHQRRSPSVGEVNATATALPTESCQSPDEDAPRYSVPRTGNWQILVVFKALPSFIAAAVAPRYLIRLGRIEVCFAQSVWFSS